VSQGSVFWCLHAYKYKLKYLHKCNKENIAFGYGFETNIVLGCGLCYIILSTTPSCYIFHIYTCGGTLTGSL